MEKRTNTKLQSESLKPFGAGKAKKIFNGNMVSTRKTIMEQYRYLEIMMVCVLYSNPYKWNFRDALKNPALIK